MSEPIVTFNIILDKRNLFT